jgi:hypothetical protein
MRVVCAVSFLFYLVWRKTVSVYFVDSHMVKMFRRDRQSAIQGIRRWSTERLQKFLTEVSCTSHTLFLLWHLSVQQSTERVWVVMNAMAWRGKTVIPRFAILIRSSKTARIPKLAKKNNNIPVTSPGWKVQFVSQVRNLFAKMQFTLIRHRALL